MLRSDRAPWQNRKRAWAALGLTPDAGRAGRESTITYRADGVLAEKVRGIGTLSSFDPVLAELAYTWFCPPAGRILDPFAGGAVRGLVAANLGYPYTGVDLSGAQIAANEAAYTDWAARDLIAAEPEWIEGDAAAIVPQLRPASVDYLFSCPPYGNLERYSDDRRDLSAMRWRRFTTAYTGIIAASLAALKPDRFATFVVGEVRDQKPGYLRGLGKLTVEAFEAGGARFYNDAVLVNPVGTAAARMGAGWQTSRKIGRHHQYVLTFVKGDPKTATATITGGDGAG